jgi:hypothetical protein
MSCRRRAQPHHWLFVEPIQSAILSLDNKSLLAASNYIKSTAAKYIHVGFRSPDAGSAIGSDQSCDNEQPAPFMAPGKALFIPHFVYLAHGRACFDLNKSGPNSNLFQVHKGL